MRTNPPRVAVFVILSLSLLACSSSRDDEPAHEQELGAADVVASATVCQLRIMGAGDPAMNPLASPPAPEVCRPIGGLEYMPFVIKELATLWGTAPAKMCTWLPGDPSRVCDPSVTPENNAFYCGVDDSVAYDVSFLQGIEAKFGKFAAATVMAHEWGHLNQSRLGLMPAAPPMRYTIQNELSADCQAGMFVALEAIAGRPLTERDAQGAFLNFCSLGDDARGSPVPWFHPQAHGTCQQRAQAFGRGYARMLEYGSFICSPTGRDASGRPTGLNAIRVLCEP